MTPRVRVMWFMESSNSHRKKHQRKWKNISNPHTSLWKKSATFTFVVVGTAISAFCSVLAFQGGKKTKRSFYTSVLCCHFHISSITWWGEGRVLAVSTLPQPWEQTSVIMWFQRVWTESGKTAALCLLWCHWPVQPQIQQGQTLTDDVGSLGVVGELVLVLVFAVLVERALVAGCQNPLQKLQLVQAGTQAVDPQSLLVTPDGPANVCFACGPQIQRSGHRGDADQRWSAGASAYQRTDARPVLSGCPEESVPQEGCRTPVTTSSPAGPHHRWDPLNTGKVGITVKALQVVIFDFFDNFRFFIHIRHPYIVQLLISDTHINQNWYIQSWN